MRIKNAFLISAAILFLINCTLAKTYAAATIAIITDKSSGLDESPLVSLLEVELSQKEGIRLLERAAIDKILQEQQLSAAGLLDRANTVKIGKLLRADAFIILSLENQTQDANDLIRVRAAETAHGLRLLDYFEQSNNKNPKEAAERIIKKIETVINKINQPDEKLIPVGIVDIHRVQLGEKYKMLERTLPVMLSVRLSLEPQIIMLEREDLKTLLDEKLRTEGKDTKFWNSAVLIEGYLQPNNGSLEMKLSLKQAGDENIKSFTIQIEPNEPTAAIAKLSTEITKQLHETPATIQWKPELEAEEFYKQGQMLSSHSRHEEALPLFETAHALQPQNIYYTGALFETIWRIRTEIERIIIQNKRIEANIKKLQQNSPEQKINIPTLLKPGDCTYSDMELVELLSFFVRQIQRNFEKGNLSTREIYNEFSKCLGTALMGSSGYFSSSVSVNTEQIRQINRENRRIWFETFNSALQQQIIRNDYPGMNNLIRVRLAWISSVDPNELMDNLKNVFGEFIMPPEFGGKIASAKERDNIFEQAFLMETKMLSPLSIERTHLKDDNGRFLKLWQEYARELAEFDNAYVSSKGRLAIAQGISVLPAKTEKIQASNSSLKAVEDMVNRLISHSEHLDRKTKQQLIKDIKSILMQRTAPGSVDKRLSIWENLYEFFIEHKDVDSLIELGVFPLKVEFRYKPDTAKKSYPLLERITKFLQINKGDRQLSLITAQIKDFQVEIRKQFPELEFPKATSDFSVSMLLTPKDWLEQVKFHDSVLLIQGEILWIVMAINNNYSGTDEKGNINNYNRLNIGLAGINIKHKKIISMWQTTIYPAYYPRKLSGLIITDKASYISIQDVGILEFPGTHTKNFVFFIDPNTIPKEELRINKLQKVFNSNRSGENHKLEAPQSERKLKIYTQENGLPSVSITAIAQEGNKLLIAYGDIDKESGLGLYDPKTEQWETVFCSTLKDKPPFSNGKTYQIYSMLTVKPNTIFLRVMNFEPSGLWKLNTNTNELVYVRSIQEELTEDSAMSSWLKRMNLNSLREDMFLKDPVFTNLVRGVFRLGYLDLSTGDIHNNKLWARYGMSQLLIIGKNRSFEEALIIDNNILDGEPVERFVSTPYGLVGIGDGIVGLIETENTEK